MVHQGSGQGSDQGTPGGSPDGIPGGAQARCAWERLHDQLNWYDKKSVACQRWFKGTKVAQLVLGSTVPVIALTTTSRVLTALVAAVVVVLEGLQQLNQWQSNWLSYRSTAEALKHERYLFLGHAGPYTGRDRARSLAERVEGLVSQEHAKWTEARHPADEPAA